MTGTDFRDIRHFCGLSVRGAASRLRVSASTIQRWESGKTEIPSTAADALRQAASQGDIWDQITVGLTTAEIRDLIFRWSNRADQLAGGNPWAIHSPEMRTSGELYTIARGFASAIAGVGDPV